MELGSMVHHDGHFPECQHPLRNQATRVCVNVSSDATKNHRLDCAAGVTTRAVTHDAAIAAAA
jgi:hypothetical protein